MGCIDDKLIMFFATDGGKTGLFCIKFTEFDSVNFIQEKGFQHLTIAAKFSMTRFFFYLEVSRPKKVFFCLRPSPPTQKVIFCFVPFP